MTRNWWNRTWLVGRGLLNFCRQPKTSRLTIWQNKWPTVFISFTPVFSCLCSKYKHAAHTCDAIKMVKHNVRTTSRLTTAVKISRTRAKHKQNPPKCLQLLGSRFACLLLFQTAKNWTQRNRHAKGYEVESRTVARKSSTGCFTFEQKGLTFWKFDKFSGDLQCFIFQFGGAEPTNASPWRRDWFKHPLCCHYWNTYEEIKTATTIIESNQAEHRTVNNWKGFVLTFFITKSSRNALTFICLNFSLLMHICLVWTNYPGTCDL